MLATSSAAATVAVAAATAAVFVWSRRRPENKPPPRAGATNVHWHTGAVSREERWRALGQKGAVVWLTGLSGSGKSTIACAVEQSLLGRGRVAYILDGDNLRHGLNSDLGFTDADRAENVRRVAHLSRILADAGIIVLACFVSPTVSMRARVRELVGSEIHFAECYVDAPLAIAEGRDPKGLYKKARAGAIKHFTGIDSPFEPPPEPELHIETAVLSLPEAAQKLLVYLHSTGLVPSQ